MNGIEMKSRRENINLTQTELGEILGLSLSAIHQREKQKIQLPAYFEISIKTLEEKHARSLMKVEDKQND